MADIVLGIGSSHSPMLSTPWEALAGHADRDRGRVPDFEALARDLRGTLLALWPETQPLALYPAFVSGM